MPQPRDRGGAAARWGLSWRPWDAAGTRTLGTLLPLGDAQTDVHTCSSARGRLAAAKHRNEPVRFDSFRFRTFLEIYTVRFGSVWFLIPS